MQYDIAIIGLGPAGATLARLLNKTHKIVAFDKSDDTNGGFTKPCGGLLAPDAQKVLARFNLSLPKNILVSPQIFSVRTIDVDAKLIRHYQRFYINMDRYKFDKWLRNLIEPHVQIFNNTQCINLECTSHGFIITFNYNGLLQTVTARYVVGADGANSIVRKKLFPAFKIRKLVAIQQSFQNMHAAPFYSCVFDKSTMDTYAWGLNKEDYFIFGGAFEPKNARKNFELLKDKLQAFGFALENPLTTEACMLLRPTTKFCCGTEGAFLIGEAAGFISPSSFEGISYALGSAGILADTLNANHKNSNKAYKKATRKIRLKLLNKNAKSPFIYNTVLRRIIMKSGIKSIKMREE